MIKNWKYYTKKSDIGELKITKGQYMTGNILGILVEEKDFLNPKDNLLNAKTFDFPVRYKTVREYTGANYNDVANDIHSRILELETEGCRAIIASGGQLGLFSSVMHEATDLLVLSSPLEILEFASVSISEKQYLCIANSLSVDFNIAIMNEIGIHKDIIEKCIYTDVGLKSYRDYNNRIFTGDVQMIGSYIWDCVERPNDTLEETNCPVYSIVTLAQFIKNVVMQMPYEGGI